MKTRGSVWIGAVLFSWTIFLAIDYQAYKSEQRLKTIESQAFERSEAAKRKASVEVSGFDHVVASNAVQTFTPADFGKLEVKAGDRVGISDDGSDVLHTAPQPPRRRLISSDDDEGGFFNHVEQKGYIYNTPSDAADEGIEGRQCYLGNADDPKEIPCEQLDFYEIQWAIEEADSFDGPDLDSTSWVFAMGRLVIP